MSLTQIGNQCSAPYCREIDFLPIKCLHCQHPFCKNHSVPSSHSCEHDPDKIRNRRDFDSKLQRCSFKACNNPSLAYTTESEKETGAACQGCKASFCAVHRYPETHECPAPPASDTLLKNDAARNLISTHFSSQGSSHQPRRVPKRKAPTDPKKLEQYLNVERMKMRHKAIPADPKDKNSAPPLEQRLHLRVQLEDGGSEVIYWFRKVTNQMASTGKALDQLGKNHGLSADDTHPVYLYKLVGDQWALLKNDQTLEAQVKDGSTVLLSRATIESEL